MACKLIVYWYSERGVGVFSRGPGVARVLGLVGLELMGVWKKGMPCISLSLTRSLTVGRRDSESETETESSNE
jgi:hypothetical protein